MIFTSWYGFLGNFDHYLLLHPHLLDPPWHAGTCYTDLRSGNITPPLCLWLGTTTSHQEILIPVFTLGTLGTMFSYTVVDASNIMPLSLLTSTPSPSLMDQWRYLQLKDFIQSLPKPLRNTSNLTPIESAFVGDLPVERPLSYFYQALGSFSSNYPAFLYNWERDLNKNLSDQEKSSILLLTHSTSIASKIAEVNYKLLTRWHYTPATLHKLFPQKSPLCWRGCGDIASHAHIWWYCPLIRPYWLTIFYWFKEIQGSEVPNDPWYVLLHCTGESAGSYKKSITPHLLNAAKVLIPKFWKTTKIPSLRQWLREVDHLYYMEDLTYCSKKNSELKKKNVVLLVRL